MLAVREGDGCHVEVLVVEPGRVDLADRGDVEALLRRFYGQVLVDDILAEPFAEIRLSGLESHLPVMCDFSQTVLFRAGLYGGSALRAPQPVHDRHALTVSSLPALAHTVEQDHRPDVSGPSCRACENPSDQDRPRDAPPANRKRLSRTRCPCPTVNL